MALPGSSPNWHRVLVDGDAPEHKTGWWEVLSLLICEGDPRPALGEDHLRVGRERCCARDEPLGAAGGESWGGKTGMRLQLCSQEELESSGFVL